MTKAPALNFCNKCSQPKDNMESAVIGDVYYENICADCLSDNHSIPLDGQFNREREREDYKKELIQPYKEGAINKDFVEAYPEEAKKMFSEQQLKEF